MAQYCFQLQTTRGPHSGAAHRYCHVCAAPSTSSPAHVLVIGRKKHCWLRLPQDLEVSSVHAEFRVITRGTSVAIRDAASTNGTKLNGKQLEPHEDYPLSSGDLIAVGRTSLRFVQGDHGQLCGQKEEDIAATTDVLVMSSISSPVATSAAIADVIVLDNEDSRDDNDEKFQNVTKSEKAPIDQPDTEPPHDKLVPKSLVLEAQAGELEKRLDVALKAVGDEDEARNELMPEIATCTECKAVIGQLDLQQQQVHLNKCLGGRVFLSAASWVKGAQPKRRPRGKGRGANVAARQRRPKAKEDGADAKLPRKRKRAAGAGANVDLALTLTLKAKNMSKEKQTDAQLTAAKMKLAQVDEEMAILAKRRSKLVKSLDRLEKTKEKLRESQVLPPAKVFELLNLKAALDVIFPSNCKAHPVDEAVSQKQSDDASGVTKQGASNRWMKFRRGDDVAAVDPIPMWARASQQRFALQNDTLLYSNSVFRPYLGDHDNTDGDFQKTDNAGDAIQEGSKSDKCGDVSDTKMIVTHS